MELETVTAKRTSTQVYSYSDDASADCSQQKQSQASVCRLLSPVYVLARVLVSAIFGQRETDNRNAKTCENAYAYLPRQNLATRHTKDERVLHIQNKRYKKAS